MRAVQTLCDQVNTQAACATIGVPRASFYRWQKQESSDLIATPSSRRQSKLALSATERQAVLDTLNSERFVDQSPGEVYAILLDERRYLCSERTMYRLLAQAGEVRERRRLRRRSGLYAKSELLATSPNQVWSWDITKLKGAVKWSYFYLYVIMDIFSRYVVGWMIADRESAVLANILIKESCEKQLIQQDQLTLHADRGSSMKSKQVAHLLADLGITKTHNRPYTSNDNPYSESQFKTLKYCPAFPDRFGCIQDARSFCQVFFKWYNHEHRHSGINRLTPKALHYGEAKEVLRKRNQVLAKAFKDHPERFKYKQPNAGHLPTEAWINPPKAENKEDETME